MDSLLKSLKKLQMEINQIQEDLNDVNHEKLPKTRIDLDTDSWHVFSRANSEAALDSPPRQHSHRPLPAA